MGNGKLIKVEEELERIKPEDVERLLYRGVDPKMSRRQFWRRRAENPAMPQWWRAVGESAALSARKNYILTSRRRPSIPMAEQSARASGSRSTAAMARCTRGK